MPPRLRNPDNNPTERFNRLLTEYGDWIAHVEWIEEWLATEWPEALQHLPPRPSKEHYAVESKHQQAFGSRNVRVRKYMKLMRSASDGPPLSSMKQLKDRAIAQKPSIPAWQKQILAELELEERSAPPTQASLIDAAAEADARIGLPPGVEIEPDPETARLDEDLKDGSLFK
jgi:primosomal protein N'